VTDVIGPGSLKLVTASSPHRSLRDVLRDTLRAHAGDNDLRHLHGETFLVYTDAEPATIRDWLAPVLGEDETAVAVEFERWSSHGPAADRTWLLRRGH